YNISYDLSERTKIYGSYSIHNQFINRVSISPFGNSDQFYWVLTDDEEYPVIRGRHFILGTSYQKGKWYTEIEAYRKTANGILESRFALESNFNGLEKPEDDDLLLPSGSNRTIGIDFLIKRKTDRYVTWVSYTLSDSENTFDLLNNGDPFAANFDQRHELNWVNIYKTGKWEFSSVFIYGSGRPYTTRGEVSTSKIILFDVTNFNAFRLRDYHRLDLSAKYITNWKKIKLETGVTLFNIYNRENVKSRRFSLRYNLNDERDQIESVTAFPVETSLLGFIPNLFIYLNF
ncbi:MAG: TonB-dependent receptor, partial [Cyclobacteriaceae bacterium]